MLGKCLIALSVAAIGVAITVAWRGDVTTAQPNQARAVGAAQPPADPPPEANKPALKTANPLPISQVVLFNSGVGYFHRTGMVEGDALVDLQFQASDINDLIKSLVIDDSHGKVLPLRYDSQEPIEKTLRSFAINLSTNPSFGQILNQARGEKVELTLVSNNSGLPGTLTGAIVGMESAHRLPTPTATATAEMELVNLMCSEGLRTVPINQIQRLRFLNPAIENELRRALEVVASGHDSQKKYVRLGFRGEGKREVKVGYVTENPIWKTSYRVVLDKDGKTKLLGWANIENTSDEDWHDIKLTLVSSRPISFQMDLYPPLFIPRPTVEPELFASLRPPTYGGPMSSGLGLGQFGGFNGFNGQFGFQGGAGGFGGGFQGGIQGGIQGGMQNFTNWNFATNGINNGMVQQGQPNPAMFNNSGAALPQQPNGNRFQNNFDNNLANTSRLTWNDLQQRNKNPQQQAEAVQKAKQVGSILAGVDPDLIQSALTAEELGNPARFVIEEKVTLPRQQSAMIPILEQPIEATRVSIYNQGVQVKHPLFGLKIKNNSKQSLMQGPIAVYDDEQFVGDARILDLQPGEERFVSYAIDTGVEVLPFDKVVPAPEMTARMENGRLQVQYKLRTTRTYVVKNRSPESRKVVIEQPVRNGWKFTESRKSVQTAPGKKGEDGVEKEATWTPGDFEKKPTERTRDLYRFMVDVKSGETVKYEVSEELPRIDPFESGKQADWTGFATTLGLDVWTDTYRTPEALFGLDVGNNVLKVTHKDRRTTIYHIKNRADEDRTVTLEHFVPKERRLIGGVKPESDDGRRYRFPLLLKKGQTLTQTVVEEFESARPENFALKVGAYTAGPNLKGEAPEAGDLPAERYITDLGFEVWQTRRPLPETLINGKFIKGELQTAAREGETVTYHIRNLTGEQRTFLLDHHVRPAWSYVGTEKPVEGIRNCFRFTLKAAGDQMVKNDVTEQKTMIHKESLEGLSEDRVKALLASDGIGGAVKENIRQGTSMIKALQQTTAALKELRAQLKEITDEQARIKGNLEKLPADSDLYKRLIDKFGKQETALEKVQAQIGDKAADEKKQKKDYESFLEKLNVQ